MHPLIIAQCLLAMGVPRPTQKFLQELLAIWLTVRGRFNFANLSRYSAFCERTLRRGFERSFNWSEFNCRLLTIIIPAKHELVAALDASFVPKSGKRTAGLGFFFNGCAGRVEKGLELSLLSIIDVTANTAYALGAQQTIPGEEITGKGKRTNQSKRATTATRIDHYLSQVEKTRPLLPVKIGHLVVDGYYTCRKFVDGICDLDLYVVGKLRKDAGLVYPYQGPQKRRGRRRLYAERVQWSNLDDRYWQDEGQVEKGVHLQSALLHHRTLGRMVRVAVLQQQRSHGTSQALLFSTDLTLSGRDIVRFYRARFQIEFLFRDAKGSMGLSHCQARSARALDFHWNAAFCALNVAKWQEAQRSQTRGFSVVSCKQRCSNERLLEVFSCSLGLDWMSVKSHPAYQELCNYGAITP